MHKLKYWWESHEKESHTFRNTDYLPDYIPHSLENMRSIELTAWLFVGF